MIFKCLRCGNCCRIDGFVKISNDEANVFASYLKLPVIDFLEEFTVLSPDRNELVLKENTDHSCIFLKNKNHCMVNEIKPAQCENSPNIFNHKYFEDYCKFKKLERYKKSAKNLFHGQEKFNCIQTIFKIFQQDFQIQNDKIKNAQNLGGGKVPNEYCGALWAICEFALKDQDKIIFTELFEKSIGDTKCKSIRKEKEKTCIDCIETAIEIIFINLL